MTSIDRTNPLTNMLANAFNKFDKDGDGKLNAQEYRSFYEILKPGIALDEHKQPLISEQDYRARMDADSDGLVSSSEALGATVLMPADLTSESLDSMLQYLVKLGTDNSLAAASSLAANDAASPLTEEKSQ